MPLPLPSYASVPMVVGQQEHGQNQGPSRRCFSLLP